MNTKLKYLSVVIASSFSLIACGGGGSSDPEPTPPENQTGSLALTISGLPSSSAADIKLSGPNGFSQTVKATETLNELPLGTYTIEALEVTANNLRFITIEPQASVIVSAENTTQHKLTYGVPKTSDGAITGFGSVYVNGVRYNTDEAQFSHNDIESSEDALSVGMQVTVNSIQPADNSQAIATEVTYSAHAKGRISGIDLSSQSLSVLGQIYLVNELSQFEDIQFNELHINNFVEISAIATQNGQYYISHLAIDEQDHDQKIRGSVTHLNTDTKTFNLGQLVINYHNSDINGTIREGAQVEVESDNAPIDFVLLADEVTVTSLIPTSGELIAIEGIITDFEDDILTVNQQSFKLHDNTDFTLGDEDSLIVGAQISLVATTQGEELALINSIRVEQVNELEIEGVVTSISVNSFTLAGQEFTVDEFTHYEDDSDEQLRRFNFENINIGDILSVNAFESQSILVARSVEREKQNDEEQITEFKGPVTAFDLPTLSVKGITVTTNTLTEFENQSDQDITQTQFFSELTLSQEVEIKAIIIEGTLLALDIEITDEQDNKVDLEGKIDTFESSSSFTVNGHPVITNEFTEFENGTSEQLSLSLEVEIEGVLNNSGIILATEIEFEQADNEVELAGNITDVAEHQFTLENQLINFDDNTEFENGSAADLVVDRFVEVEANLLSDGTLLATEVEFDERNELTISGNVANYDSVNSFFILDQQVHITEQTEFENGNKALLTNGLLVSVSGSLNTDNILIAAEIEFETTQDKTVEGQINNFNGSNDFTVANQAISVTSFTEYEKGTANNIENGSLVKVEGKLNKNSVLIADKLEFVDAQKVDIEGVVDSFTSIHEFTVNAQAITTDSSTEFENDSFEQLNLGSKVKIEGYLDRNILRATKVDLD